jgi:hypothetical protein
VVHPHNVSEAIIVQTTDRPNKFEIVNRRTGRPMQIQDMAALPDGRYAVDHQYGLGIGFVDVRAGSIRHLSLAGDEQNLEGPSFVPVPGSPEPIRYALAGNIVDESRWKAAIAASKVLGVKEFEHLLAAGRIGSDEAFSYNLGAFIDRAAARRIERREEMAAGASMEFSRD